MNLRMFAALLVCFAGAAVRANEPAPADGGSSKSKPEISDVQSAPAAAPSSPLVVASKEVAQAQEDKRVQAENDARIVFATDAIAAGTCVLAIATILLWIFTYRLWKTSSDAARASDLAAQDQLKQVTRSAAAMEITAAAMRTNAELFPQLLAKQARAYVAVLAAGAVYQETDKHFKFSGTSVLVNSGMTPAHHVRHRAQAGILPHPLPEDFEFPLPAAYEGGPVLNPREQYKFKTAVPDFIPEDEVADIKAGASGRALYVWGLVAYEDAYGSSHVTKFCHTYLWFGAGEHERWEGYYDRRHNEST